jgi:hypothetical protein
MLAFTSSLESMLDLETGSPRWCTPETPILNVVVRESQWICQLRKLYLIHSR